MTKRVVLVAAVITVLIAGVLLAQESTDAKQACKATAQLSEEQCAKLADLKLQRRMACIKLGAEIEVLQLKMEQELSKNDPNAREIESLVSSIGAARDKLLKQCIDLQLQSRKIVGPEKWTKIKGCFGSMGPQNFEGMDCMGSVGCGLGGGSSMGMGCSTWGQCRMSQCSSINENCCGTCCGGMMGRSACQGNMERMMGCAPDKSSCKDVEQRCVKIRVEE
jgi:hypothetical protein